MTDPLPVTPPPASLAVVDEVKRQLDFHRRPRWVCQVGGVYTVTDVVLRHDDLTPLVVFHGGVFPDLRFACPYPDFFRNYKKV